MITQRVAIESYKEMIECNKEFALDLPYHGFKTGSHGAAVAYVLDKFDLKKRSHKKQLTQIFVAFKEDPSELGGDKVSIKTAKKIVSKISRRELGRFFSYFPWATF